MNNIVLAVAIGIAIPAAVAAQDARAIMEEAQRRADVHSQHYEGLLQVFDAKGKISDKRWTFDRIGSHGTSRSVVKFSSPAEVNGVALLVINHPERASDQWMWTPAVGRERRIALQDRSQRFFGTDFSFEDLEERDTAQYDYTLVGEESLDGVACWKIESRPRKTKVSQYTRSIIWMRQDNYLPLQTETYIKADLARRLKYSRMEPVQGVWSARVLEMTDVRRKSRTVLTLEKLQYNVPMNEQDFTLQGLRRDP
jgi:hypothetical protein